MTDLTVAQTILAQLGGNRFVAMTGAKNMVGSPDALSFQLPRGFAKLGINRVNIRHTRMDCYGVSFGKRKPSTLTIVPVLAFGEVYAEDLRRIFTDATGLDCSMGLRAA